MEFINKNILVTGGTGYIGVHTIVSLLQSGYDVTVVDNLINSSEYSLGRAITIAGVDSNRVRFFKVDITDRIALEKVFQASPRFTACIHFAGLKAVGESVRKPLLYYSNNIDSTIILLELLDTYKCTSFVFSSSATVYGSAPAPIAEDVQTGLSITNPYGRTKYMIEEIIKDFKIAKDMENKGTDEKLSITILRYFNPVGAHPSGLIGEDPNGIPNNLMPYVAQVAVGRREKLTIFGNDYPTKDGTGVRDFIHVVDLAEGHVAALRYLEDRGDNKLSIFNLGSGIGYSVLDMVNAMSRACGHQLAYEFGPRREGDLAEYYADPRLAEQELGWKATRSMDDICKDLWAWQSANPNGYTAPQ